MLGHSGPLEVCYYTHRRFMMLHTWPTAEACEEPSGVTDVRTRYLRDMEEATDDGQVFLTGQFRHVHVCEGRAGVQRGLGELVPLVHTILLGELLNCLLLI